jgi:hypothetical protein
VGRGDSRADGHPDAAPALLAACEDREGTVREQALLALGTTADETALPVLPAALGQLHEPPARAAAVALCRLVRRHPDPALRTALPALRLRASHPKPDASTRYEDPFSEAVRLISTLTDATVELPLPGTEPAPTGNLPLPAPGEV